MHWLTWTNIGVDRMACAWLITHVLDPAPIFHFVPSGQPLLPTDAEAFDIPGVRLSHRHGHSSFHTMVQVYGVTDPVIHRLARIVDEADVVQDVSLESAASGLDLICRGLRQISPDDTTALAHGLLLYDALYAQLALDMGLSQTTPARLVIQQ